LCKELNFEKDQLKRIVFGQNKADARKVTDQMQEGSQLNITGQEESEFAIRVRIFGVETAQRDGSGVGVQFLDIMSWKNLEMCFTLFQTKHQENTWKREILCWLEYH